MWKVEIGGKKSGKWKLRVRKVEIEGRDEIDFSYILKTIKQFNSLFVFQIPECNSNRILCIMGLAM